MKEIDALLHDVDIIAEGGRVLPLYRGQIRQRQELPAANHPQLCDGRRALWWWMPTCPRNGASQGTKGQGLATYKELIQQHVHQDQAGGRRAVL